MTKTSVSGIIHLVLVTAGGSRFYWNLDDAQLYPAWPISGNSGAAMAQYPANVTRDVLPIPVHSHNDYRRRMPLFDALYWGCTSVEADVWLRDGGDELYVGHDTGSLTNERTFRSLYVDPIAHLLDEVNQPDAQANGSWRGVFEAASNETL